MSSEDSRRDLAEALLQVTEAQRIAEVDTRRARARPTGTPRRSALIALAAAALLAWLWIARPAAVFAPDGAEPLSPAAAEARARVALYLERARIEDYRRTNGRLPSALAEAGAVEAGVTYRPTDQGYLLEWGPSGRVLQLTSRMDADSFLGSAAAPNASEQR